MIKVASVEVKEELIEEDGIKVHVKYGEFSSFLSKVCEYLEEAQKHCANETQNSMIS